MLQRTPLDHLRHTLHAASSSSTASISPCGTSLQVVHAPSTCSTTHAHAPCTLTPHAGLPPIESLTAVKRQQLESGNPHLGIDCNDVGTNDMRKQNVFETLSGKKQQLFLATQGEQVWGVRGRVGCRSMVHAHWSLWRHKEAVFGWERMVAPRSWMLQCSCVGWHCLRIYTNGWMGVGRCRQLATLQQVAC